MPRFVQLYILVATAFVTWLCLHSLASAATLARIENGRPGTATFLYSGPIVAGDHLRLAEALVKLAPGTPTSVILDSPGGLVSEGLVLGRMFHTGHIATIVKGDGAICFSACALAFLGGRDARSGMPLRIKMSGGKLGFHQFRRVHDPLKIYTKVDYEAEVAHAQTMTSLIVRYLRDIGEDLAKLQLMLRAPSERMNIIGDDECLRQGFHVLQESTGRLIAPPRDLRQAAAATAGHAMVGGSP